MVTGGRYPESKHYSQGNLSDKYVWGGILGASGAAPGFYRRFWFQKLSGWGPLVCFPILSTSQTFAGLEPEPRRMDSPPSTSCWESFPVARKLGRTPNVAQRALYRALIWRNNLGISTSAEGSDSEDPPEDEGLVRGNWEIVSNRTRMLWMARLVQNQRSTCRWDGSARAYELFRSSGGFVDLFPGQSEPFVEPEFFKHLVAFLATEGTTFDQPMDPAVGETVFIPFIVEP